MPVNRFLKLRLVARSSRRAVVAMPLRPAYRQEGGVVHGGLVATLADTAAVYLVLPHLRRGNGMTSIEFKINFLRPALVDSGELMARSRLVKRGRRVAVCEVEVRQGGRAVARGLFTYLVLASRSGGKPKPSPASPPASRTAWGRGRG